MPKRMPLLLHGSNRFFPFNYLLSSACASLKAAELIDKLNVMDIDKTELDLGGRNLHLASAVVYSAFAIEAAINHVGIEHIPKWDKKEWGIKGLTNRLTAIADHFKTTIDCTNEPVTTLLAAHETRNNLAHGKPWKSDEVYLDDGESDCTRAPGWLTRWYADGEARKVYEAAETLIRSLFKMSNFLEHEFNSQGRGSFGTIDDQTTAPYCRWEKDTTPNQRQTLKPKKGKT